MKTEKLTADDLPIKSRSLTEADKVAFSDYIQRVKAKAILAGGRRRLPKAPKE